MPHGTTAPHLRAVVVAAAALLGAFVLPSLSPPSGVPAPSASSATPSTAAGPLDEGDGVVPDGTTVFDDRLPAVANLDSALLDALRRAATDAADDGVDLDVNSGWRSPAYQEHLFREAVAEHGSEEEAARWVATPTTSAHVRGDAVDVGSDAAAWLSRHGAEHGLCRTYDNEPWHFELRPDAVARGCPAPYADASRDPRMQS